MGARGLGRIFKRGGRYWIAYYEHGQEHRESAGSKEGDAVALLTKRLSSIHTGTYVGPEEKRLTVNQVLDAYLADLQNRKMRSAGHVKHQVKAVRARLGLYRVVELTVDVINDFIAERRALKAADGTTTQQLVMLRAAVKLAQRQRRLVMVPYIPTAGAAGIKKDFVEPDLFARIHARLEQPYADMAEFAYLTGWRYAEICGLTWACVFPDAGEIRLPITKNGQGRVLALEGRVKALLEGRRASRSLVSPYVFPGRRRGPVVDGLREAWRRATVAAGLPLIEHEGPTGLRRFSAVSVHGLRRSALRNMRRAGVTETVAMSVSGHLSAQVFRRYDITSTDDQRQALAATAAYRESWMAASKVVPLAVPTRTKIRTAGAASG